jgi:hypothetical protein
MPGCRWCQAESEFLGLDRDIPSSGELFAERLHKGIDAASTDQFVRYENTLGGWPTFETVLIFRVADPSRVSRGRGFDFSLCLRLNVRKVKTPTL